MFLTFSHDNYTVYEQQCVDGSRGIIYSKLVRSMVQSSIHTDVTKPCIVIDRIQPDRFNHFCKGLVPATVSIEGSTLSNIKGQQQSYISIRDMASPYATLLHRGNLPRVGKGLMFAACFMNATCPEYLNIYIHV